MRQFVAEVFVLNGTFVACCGLGWLLASGSGGGPCLALGLAGVAAGAAGMRGRAT